MRVYVGVTLVSLSSVVLWACGDGYVQHSQPARVVTQTTLVQPAQTTDTGPREGAERGRLGEVERRAVQGAKRTARRFLAGYLPYSYGKLKASRIRAATPALRAYLAKRTPRVPPVVAERAQPRLLDLETSGVELRRVVLQGLYEESRGGARYTALLTVVRRDGQWLVGEVR